MKTPRIEASFDRLLSQAATTVDLYLSSAAKLALEYGLGSSQTDQHNRVILQVARMIQSDFDNSCRSVQAQIVADAISNLAEAVGNTGANQ